MQDPVAHNFPHSFDQVILKNPPLKQKNGSFLFRERGFLNNKEGVFEIALDSENKIIFHRTFKGGK